jgi:endonuclease YncB( thermonuclease family)
MAECIAFTYPLVDLPISSTAICRSTDLSKNYAASASFLAPEPQTVEVPQNAGSVVLRTALTWLQGKLRRFDLPHGDSDELYGEVTQVTNGDTVRVQAQNRTTPVRSIGINTPNTVAPDEPIGCFGKVPSNYMKRMLADRLVRLEIPRIGNSEDAYGRTLADVYLDANDDGRYDYIYNEHLLELG